MAKEKTTGIADESQLDYSTAWIFDTHLVTHGCQDEALLDLPQSIESDTLYLVGDVIDFWRVRRARYWPQSHYNVIQKLLRSARKGDLVSFPGAGLSCRADLTYAEAGCRMRSGSQGTGSAFGILSRAPR